MKALKQPLRLAGLAGLLVCAIAQADDAPPPTPPAQAPAAAMPDAEKLKKDSPAEKTAKALTKEVAAGMTNSPAEQGLRLNFRGVPLEMVLNYLSDAAGFIIVLETEVKGNVDVWSNKPLNKEEAVELLNAVLSKNGYTAVQNGRTLTVMGREDAKKRDIPVRSGSDPARIPKNEEIVTQVIPLRALSAVQLAKDLSPLIPAETTLAANEAGNALVMTDTQTNIRRIAEIIKALDSSSSSFSSIKVFPLQFADAKSIVTIIKEVFPDTSSSRGSSSNDPRAQFYEMMRSRFGGGDHHGPPSPSSSSSSGGGSRGGSRVAAAADENSNSVVVSAPEELMHAVEGLIKEIDSDVDEITEVRVFHLKFADPTEMADLLSGLFPDDSGTTTGGTSSSRSAYRFGSRNSRSSGSRASNTSERMKRMTRVIAIPDPRTAAVVVSAEKGLMTQIAAMIEELDGNPAKKQKVYVYSLENADVQTVEEVLRNLFDSGGNSSRSGSRNQNNNNALTTRSQQLQNYTTSPGFGNGSSQRRTQ